MTVLEISRISQTHYARNPSSRLREPREWANCNCRTKEYVGANPLSSKVILLLPADDRKWQLSTCWRRWKALVYSQLTFATPFSPLSRAIRHSRWPGPKSASAIRKHLSANTRNQFAHARYFSAIIRSAGISTSVPIKCSRIIEKRSPLISVKNEGAEWCFTRAIKLHALFFSRMKLFLLTYIVSSPVYAFAVSTWNLMRVCQELYKGSKIIAHCWKRVSDVSVIKNAKCGSSQRERERERELQLARYNLTWLRKNSYSLRIIR